MRPVVIGRGGIASYSPSVLKNKKMQWVPFGSPVQSARYELVKEESILRSILHGLRWLVLVGWIPFLGPFIAGYQAGSHRNKASGGVLVGVAVGLFGSLILAGLFAILAAIIAGILFGAGAAIIGGLTMGALAFILLIFYGITDIALCTLGGLVGGAVEQSRRSSFITGRSFDIPTAAAFVAQSVATATQTFSYYYSKPVSSNQGSIWRRLALRTIARSVLRRFLTP
jgi:hypothetical protein